MGGRQIKFRVFGAWSPNHETPTMGYFNPQTYKAMEMYQIRKMSCHWMQYTGLKDKHDKDIYEGDILEGRQEVFYNKGSFFLKNTRLGCDDLLGAYGCRYAVIGNIYENPNLLDGK